MANEPSYPLSGGPTSGPLAEGPFPELAEALRDGIGTILRDWQKQVRANISAANSVGFDELLGSTPDILAKMADALASGDPEEITHLMERSPSQGIHRFQLHYDARELATEDRMLRRLILWHTGAQLGRRTTGEEEAALNWAIDLMAQQAMVAFVGHQSEQLRAAAEAELQYLSFLSHDLSGHLANVTLWLKVLRQRLSDSPQFDKEVSTLDAALQTILDTRAGMTRLLEAERLRHQTVRPEHALVNLHDLSSDVAGQFRPGAEGNGLKVVVEIPPDAVASIDGGLVRLVLQNLIGNAVKYSTRGTVRVIAGRRQATPTCPWTLSVSDEGPGIGAEHLTRIFEAFGRGQMHGQAGLGLGLAIASRAAKLLGAELTVESKVGAGSTFRLALPPK